MKTGEIIRNGVKVLEAQCEGCGLEFETLPSSVIDEDEECRYCLDCERIDTEVQTKIWLDRGTV